MIRQTPGPIEGPQGPVFVCLVDESGEPYTASSGGGGTVTANQGTPGLLAWPVEFLSPQEVIITGQPIDVSGSSVTILGTVTVTGTVSVGNTVTVTGPLTDAQLRATPVPISGTVTANVTNPLPVTGPLTDTQLRASAVPVSAASLPLPTGAATAANQSTEITSLASIKTNTDPLVASGAGGYVRQDSTATIAKETGGNLATVKTNTDPLVASGGGGYIRQDSTATIAKESGGNLATIAGSAYVKGLINQVGTPSCNRASDNGTPITTATTTDVVAAPSAGNHLEIVRLHVANSSATPVLVQFKEAGGNLFFAAYLPQYGIMSIKLDSSWRLTTATKLQLVTSAAGSIYWTVESRTVAD